MCYSLRTRVYGPVEGRIDPLKPLSLTLALNFINKSHPQIVTGHSSTLLVEGALKPESVEIGFTLVGRAGIS